MTAGSAAPFFRCAGCGREVAPSRAMPFPFRCPNARDDDGKDHVLARVRSRTEFPQRADTNPFLRYRELAFAHAFAMSRGMTDDAYVELVTSLDAQVAAAWGGGFRVTPCFASAPLADAAAVRALVVKDETDNVSGSHKARHLFGILSYLEVARAVGVAPATLPPLGIASCGNAALAAGVVAAAARAELTVFIPPDANARVVERLARLGAHIEVCARDALGEAGPGDPCYLAFKRALAAGSMLPFCCQGSDAGLTICGGETLAYELAEAAAPPVDAVFVQVGGGALASSVVSGLRVARDCGVIRKLPRICTVQTRAAFPLKRAYDRIAERVGAMASGLRARADALAACPPERRNDALAYAATHRAEFMWPWEEPPHSVAHGILDDETYDFLAVVAGMFESGGYPVVVSEATLAEANRLAKRCTGIAVDATGSAGLAGVLAARQEDAALADDRVAVIFSGKDRDAER